MPAFITFSDPIFTIHPTLFTQVGTFQIFIDLSDGQPLTTSYNFFVTVTNTAPSFPVGTVLANQTLGVNATLTFTIPTYSDLDNNLITVTTYEAGKLVLPAFIIFADPVFTINPTLFTQVGTFQIFVDLSDGQPLTTSYNFFVTLTNTVPVFTTSPLSN